jgi:hypothetical protein
MTPEELTRLKHEADLATAEADRRTAALHAGIVEAARDRIPKDTVRKITGLSKERVRVIERAGGAPTREAGRPHGSGRNPQNLPSETK